MDVTKLKKGEEHFKQDSKGGFLRNIYWKNDRESKYLAVLTPAPEVIKIDIHPFIKTPKGWRTFVCRKYPAFAAESGGHCPLCDVYAKKPATVWLYLAAELEVAEESRKNGRRVIKSFKLKTESYETKDGEQRSVPIFGMVQAKWKNFQNPLISFMERKGDPVNYVLEVVRNGKDNSTTYSFFEHEDLRPDFEEYEDVIPDLLPWIAEKGSAEYYASELEGYVAEDEDEAPKSNKPKPAQAATVVIERDHDEPESVEEDEATSEDDQEDRFAELVKDLQAREAS